MSKLDSQFLTERLELRLLTLDDTEDIFNYASDPAVTKNTAWFMHGSIEDTEAFVRFVLDAHSDEEGSLRHVWAIRVRGEPQAVGTIDLVQDQATLAHIDFALARPHWGKGIVTEAAFAVVDWGFRRLPELAEIRSGGLSRNVGTMRVLEKLGFRLWKRTTVARPPKFAEEELEASHFVLSRESFYDAGGAAGDAQ